MPIASLTNIEKTFGPRTLFDRLNLLVDRGERIGLIGANGAGKTSLFRALTGELEVDAGTVAVSRGVRLGVLSQDPVFDPANTVLDEAELAFADLHRLSHLLRELEHAMADVAGEALEKVLGQYQTAQHEFDLAGGYAWRHRLEATLLGIGLGRETWEQNVQTLSGGQRSRLALSKLLISGPDVLLLDEPTNHLDLAAIEWLEKYLLDFAGATVLISHDRYLLDRLATRIVWLTRAKLNSYPGNYSAFVQQREVQELSQQRAHEQQQADIEKQKEFIRRFGAGQRSREAKGREKRLDRLLKSDAIVEAVDQQKAIRVPIGTDQRAGDRVLDVRGLSKAYEGKVLWQGLGFEVKRGERVGIIGPNGSGKTTLLECLLGSREPDAGEVRWGANLNIGYYDQRLDDFDPHNTVTEEVRGDRVVKDQDLRGVLALLLFRGEDVDKRMDMLSGGERARVALAQLLLDKPNVLVLDEPTNHLDIASCEALEGALADFAGTILCVSHDRYFLDQTVTRLLVLRPAALAAAGSAATAGKGASATGVADFAGNYSEWAAKLREGAESEGRRKSAAEDQRKADEARRAKSAEKGKGGDRGEQAVKGDKKAGNPYLRPFGRLSLKDLEREITETEIAIAECQESFGDPGTFKDAERGKKAHEGYEALVKKLEQLEAEYFAREQ